MRVKINFLEPEIIKITKVSPLANGKATPEIKTLYHVYLVTTDVIPVFTCMTLKALPSIDLKSRSAERPVGIGFEPWPNSTNSSNR